MKNVAIMRIQKRRDIGSIRRCAQHHLRTVDTPNADSTRGFRVLQGSNDVGVVTRQIGDVTKPLMKRKDNIRCLDVLCAASPGFFTSGGSTAEFESLAMKWAADTFGAENIVLAVTHEDETSPHVQLLITPVIKGRLSASHWIDGPKKLRHLQNTYAAAMAPVGLVRGVEGSKAKHESIRAWYAKLEPASREAKKIIDQADEVRAEQARWGQQLDRATSTLNGRAADIVALEAQLDARSIALDAKAEQLDAKARQLDRRAEVLDQRGNELARRAVLMDRMRDQLDQQAHDLNNRAHELDDRAEKLSSYRAQLDRLSAFLAKQKDALVKIFRQLPRQFQLAINAAFEQERKDTTAFEKVEKEQQIARKSLAKRPAPR